MKRLSVEMLMMSEMWEMEERLGKSKNLVFRVASTQEFVPQSGYY